MHDRSNVVVVCAKIVGLKAFHLLGVWRPTKFFNMMKTCQLIVAQIGVNESFEAHEGVDCTQSGKGLFLGVICDSKS